MIRVSNLCKSYGSQLVFEDLSFSLQAGEHLGVVGRNGHGKTTLFKIILQIEHQDSGEVFLPKNYRLGHLSQHLVFTEPTILQEVCLALPEYEGGWKEEYKAEEMLGGLGFSRADFQRAPGEFSGGYQIRLNLAKLLLSEPNLLLLDEPTNYLDILAVRWLGEFLRQWPNEFMLITHDRDFMDSVTTHTMAIHRQKAKKLPGNTEKVYAQILQEEEIYEQTRKGAEKRIKEVEKFITRFRAKASKAKAVQSRIKMLEKMEVGSELEEIESLDFRFTERPLPGKFAAHIQDLEFGYPGTKPLFSDLSLAIGRNDRIAVIGPNGKGKTTLLSLLAGDNAPTSGSISFNENSRVAYFGQTNINRLDLKNTVEKELINSHIDHNRGVARSVAGLMMFDGDQALKTIGVLSGGERSRVMLGKILLTPANLLLLDEPTNHLDMDSIESLVEAIEEFNGAVLIVTHSEAIIRRLANRLIVFDRGRVEVFEGGYDDFLSRIGWSDERDDAVSEAKPATHEERKREKREFERVERKIVDLEARLSTTEADLVKASEQANIEDITRLSRNIQEIRAEIDNWFDKLED